MEETEPQFEEATPIEVQLIEYMAFSEEFKRHLTFRYYFDYQDRVKYRGGNIIPTLNFELQRTIDKISLPYFDGSTKCTTNSWMQKLDTYF